MVGLCSSDGCVPDYGKLQDKPGPRFSRTLHADAPFVIVHNGLDQREPETPSLLLTMMR